MTAFSYLTSWPRSIWVLLPAQNLTHNVQKAALAHYSFADTRGEGCWYKQPRIDKDQPFVRTVQFSALNASISLRKAAALFSSFSISAITASSSMASRRR